VFVFVSPTIAIIDISVTSIMRRSAAEYKVLVAYSLAVRPSDSDMRLIAENMQTLLRPEDALTMLCAKALGRGLGDVFQSSQTMTDACASIATKIQEKGVVIVVPVGPTTTMISGSCVIRLSS
jgi:hypothetical protein